MSLATRCPACGTIFRVVQDQLKVSEGWVRCGQCHEVFHGIEALFDLDSDPAMAARRAGTRPPAPTSTRGFADARASAPIPLPRTQAPPTFAPTAPGGFASTMPGGFPPTSPAPLDPPQPPPPPARSPIAFPARAPAPVDGGRSIPATPSMFAPSMLPDFDFDVGTPTGGRPGFAPAPTPAAQAPAPRPQPPAFTRGTMAPRFAARLAEEAARAQAANGVQARVAIPAPPLQPQDAAVHAPTAAPEPAPATLIAAPMTPPVAPIVVAEPAPPIAPEPPFAPAAEAPASPAAPTMAEASPVAEPTPGPTPGPIPEPIAAEPASFEPASATPSPPTAAELAAAAFAAAPPAPLLPAAPEPAPEAFPVAVIGPVTPPTAPAEDDSDERAGPPTLASLLPEDAGDWPPRKSRKKREAGASELALVDPSKDPRFLREARAGARWRKPWVRASLGVVALMLAAAAAGQLAWPQRDSLASRWPETRPAWDWLCAQAGCRIEPPRSLASLALDGSSLTRTDTEHVLLFSADLHNRSSHEVRMPSFDLSFTDLNGAVVARKVLSPTQIGIRLAALPPEGELHVHARLLVSGLDATGFNADLFYP